MARSSAFVSDLTGRLIGPKGNGRVERLSIDDMDNDLVHAPEARRSPYLTSRRVEREIYVSIMKCIQLYSLHYLFSYDGH